MGVVEDHLASELSPILSPHLDEYVSATAKMFEEIELYSTDQGDDWDTEAYSIMLDIDRAEEKGLPYLSCYVGVELPVGAGETEARSLIRAQKAAKRGTPADIIDTAQRTLTGTKYVRLVERTDGNAYRATVITRTSETPDPAATQSAIDSVKPAGIILTHVATEGEAWDEAVSDWDGVPGGTTWDSTMTINV